MLTKPEKAKNLLQKRLFAIETKKRFQLELIIDKKLHRKVEKKC